jgi:hypothetical protein
VKYVLIILAFLTGENAISQSCPANIDFEQGDFTGWQCYTGTTTVVNGQNKINLNPSEPKPNRHEIISANSDGSIPLDYYGGFPKLCPYSGRYSVKLGNTGTGAEAEGISYTFVVPSSEDTFSFTYFYAVVFEDPQHPLPQEPRFFVSAYETETGKLINCASYNYVSTSGLPGLWLQRYRIRSCYAFAGARYTKRACQLFLLSECQSNRFGSNTIFKL